MPKTKKEDSEESIEEESVENKKDKRKSKKSTETPKKKEKKTNKKKKDVDKDDEENSEADLEDDLEEGEEKTKKGKKKILKLAAVKKILKSVRRDISQLKTKVNKRPYKKYFEEEARSPAEYTSIINNIDMIVVQLGKYEEACKRKASHRYLKSEVVEFMNKYPISDEQPTIETIGKTGKAVSNKDMVSKFLHAYLKKHCTKQNTGNASSSAFSSIVYELDKPLKKLIKTLSGGDEYDPLPFSKISTVGAMCTYKDINPLDEDIENYESILEWFSKYQEPEPEKGTPKKRGRKPKAKEEEVKEEKKDKGDKKKSKKDKEEKEDKKEEKADKNKKKSKSSKLVTPKKRDKKRDKKEKETEDEESF